jgi:predicted DNA-binding protein with PD1-like motif
LLKSFETLQQDIASKVIAFSQQGPRAICVLSASGAVSTATLIQPSASPGAIKYEGRFEILALSTSYIVATDGSFRNRTGNLSVSLASPDGRVIGGAIGGPLIAASPVQVWFTLFS